MNENDLARLLPVPADRDLPADRKQILQEHLMTELRQADQPGHTSTKTRTRPPRRRPVLAAGAVLAAAAVAGPPSWGRTRSPPRPRSPSRPRPPSPPPSCWSRRRRGGPPARSQPARQRFHLHPRHGRLHHLLHEPRPQQDQGRPPAAARGAGLAAGIQPVRHRPGHRERRAHALSPFPVVNGKPRTTPRPGGTGPDITCPTRGEHRRPHLPVPAVAADHPVRLLAVLKAGKKQTNDDPPTLIGDLIRNTIVPPPCPRRCTGWRPRCRARPSSRTRSTPPASPGSASCGAADQQSKYTRTNGF